MSKNRVFIILAVFACSVTLGACAGRSDDSKIIDQQKEKIEKAVKENNLKTEEAKGEPEEKETKEETEQEPKGLFEKAFFDKEIENNGGMFVRVADRVYYRVYSPRNLELTVIGLPSVDEVSSNHTSELMYYDLKNNKTEKVCKVSGIGALYATVDGICLDSYPDGSDSTTIISEDGTINEHYLDGNIIGVSADGRSVVIGEKDEEERMIPCLYRDGKKVGNPLEEAKEDYCRFIGFSGNSMILTMNSSGSDGITVYSYDETAELIRIGKIEPLDMETYELSPIVEDMEPDSDGGYILIGFRDGTANALVEWKGYSFSSKTPGSLDIFDDAKPDEKFDFEIPRISVNDKDEPVLSSHKAGEVYLSERTYGDLMLSVPGGDDVSIIKNYAAQQDEQMTYVKNLENGYCFDNDKAFFYEISGEHCPDEDIGWRWAYNLMEIDYKLVRIDREQAEKDGYPMIEVLEYIYSSGWNKGEIEYDRLIGEWEAETYNVEGEIRKADEENGDEQQMIRFEENGDAVDYFINRNTGKITNERVLHQIENSELLGGDYAYYFSPGDDSLLVAGTAYLSHNILAVRYVYQYDGGSLGWYEIRFRKVN